MRLAGLRLRIDCFRGPPPPLPRTARVLRRSSLPGPYFVYWQTGPAGQHRLFWSDAGTFDLDARKGRASCYLRRNARRDAVEEVLRGPLCAFFLVARGFEPLHASGALLEGRCVAFAGPPGAGKSSLVAALSRQGARFISDDMLPLRLLGRRVWAHPGLPELRLLPGAASGLGWPMARSSRSAGKRRIRLAPPSEPHPVARIYLLDRRPADRREKARVRPMSSRDAFRALLRFTRNDSVTTAARLQRQLLLFARLAGSVPVRRLIYPGGYGRLSEVLAAIRQDLKS